MTLKEKYWSNLSVEITKRIFIVGLAVQFIFEPQAKAPRSDFASIFAMQKIVVAITPRSGIATVITLRLTVITTVFLLLERSTGLSSQKETASRKTRCFTMFL